jgi:hypothetical protein
MKSEKNPCAEIFPANSYLDYHDPEAELSPGFERTTDHAVKDIAVPKKVVRIFRQSFKTAFICSAASQRPLQNR